VLTDLLNAMADAQHRVVDHLVTIRMHAYRFGHVSLDFLRNDPKLPAVSPLGAVFSLVIK